MYFIKISLIVLCAFGTITCFADSVIMGTINMTQSSGLIYIIKDYNNGKITKCSGREYIEYDLGISSTMSHINFYIVPENDKQRDDIMDKFKYFIENYPKSIIDYSISIIEENGGKSCLTYNIYSQK